MRVVKRFIDEMSILMNGDTDEFGGSICLVGLVKSPIPAGTDLAVSDLDPADFLTSDTLSAQGSTARYYDAARDQWYSRLVPPLGGFHWVTTALTNLPQTVYGYYVVNGTNELIGVQALDSPLLLTVVGQQIDIGEVEIPYSKNAYTQDPLA